MKTRYEQLVREVQAVYAEADAAAEEFCRIFGLRCVPGCGACCETGVVEATALQMLPAAFHLWRTGVASGVMRALQEGSTTNRCILYRPDESRQGHGRCGLYQYRALVCRLFGCAGRRSKRGEVEIVACRLLRAQLPPPARARLVVARLRASLAGVSYAVVGYRSWPLSSRGGERGPRRGAGSYRAPPRARWGRR